MNKYCNNKACPAAGSCSYAILYNNVSSEQDFLLTVNQKGLTFDSEGKCQHYRSPKRISVAYGFKASTEMMPKSIYANFSHQLIDMFNRTDFYAMRRGDLAISPERQEQILAVLTALSYPLTGTFWDRTEEVTVY